jgi:metal-sulfur cluster biosynthetic enzyme
MEANSVWNALRQVLDPELGINIVDLGLVYGVVTDHGRIEVVMTVTSAACPMGEELAREAAAAVRRSAPDAHDVDVRVVLHPPWDPALMSKSAKQQLGWGR